MRRIRTLLITVFLIGSITMGALAAEFPVKPIQLVVPFKPEGK